MHITKAMIYFILFSMLAVSYVIVTGVTPLLQYLYGTVIAVCLGAFGTSYLKKYRKISYTTVISSLTVFVLMNNYIPEIKEQHMIDRCLDSGMVYDPVQKICRDDCWKWDKKLGCLKG